METLSLNAVEEAWNELQTGGAADLNARVERFRREQPALSGLLLAAEDSLFAEDDRGPLLLYGLWAWQTFRNAGGGTREITPDEVENALDENQRQLSALESSSWGVMDAAGGWTKDYRQLPLLGGILNHLMSGELEEVRRVDDLLGCATLYLKTVIDCLDAGGTGLRVD